MDKYAEEAIKTALADVEYRLASVTHDVTSLSAQLEDAKDRQAEYTEERDALRDALTPRTVEEVADGIMQSLKQSVASVKGKTEEDSE